jgi:hypothetical protein
MTYTVKRAIYISVNLQLEPSTEQWLRALLKKISSLPFATGIHVTSADDCRVLKPAAAARCITREDNRMTCVNMYETKSGKRPAPSGEKH